MTFLARLFATGFFVGYSPLAPGTVGSILGVVIYWLLPNSQSLFFLFAIAFSLPFGAWCAKVVEEKSGVEDNQIIVIDEMVGVWIALLGCDKQWFWLLLACVLFRLFDITKPYPAKQSESLPDGWGVMMDDVFAGIYSLGIMKLLVFLNLTYSP